MNWLPGFLETCRREHLCMTRHCTTCGGGAFLERLRDRAAEAGDAAGARGGRTAVGHGLITGLLALEPADRDLVAAPGLAWVVDEARCHLEDEAGFDSMLRGTTAGWMVARLRAAAVEAKRRRDRRRREVERRGRADRTRRRRRGWERRVRHQERLAAKRDRDLELEALVAGYESMSPGSRLRWLVERPAGFPIDRIPEELVPCDADLLMLTRSERATLIEAIGGRRRSWRRLRNRLTASD